MKQSRRHCQRFSLTLDDGTVVTGSGQFIGPITDKDREAIQSVVIALRKIKRDGGTIDSVSLSKATTNADKTDNA